MNYRKYVRYNVQCIGETHVGPTEKRVKIERKTKSHIHVNELERIKNILKKYEQPLQLQFTNYGLASSYIHIR